MEKLCKRIQNECFNETQENENSINKKRTKNNNSDIRKCFTEYSLEDKVAALKCMLDYNEKSAENVPVHSGTTKTTTGVKECMQVNQETQFQTLISELKNTVMNSYWDKEVGKTRYQTPNLPIGMNPWETIFGKKYKFEATMTELLQAKANQMDILNPDILEMYKKSHNSYLPSEQIKRNYKQPFNPNFRYGKFTNKDINGTRVKKLLTWMKSNPVALVNSILADFKERTHPCIGEVRNSKGARLFMDMVHGKPIKRIQTNIFSDSPVNDDILEQQKYLQYINSLRYKFKKQIPEIPFLDIYEELASLDKDYTGILSEDVVISILAKYKMYINKAHLSPLLDLLDIRKEKNVNYTEFINLLNWKYDFPTLPKIKSTPLECQCCYTTYRNTIGSTKDADTTKEVLHKSFKDKTTAYDLIFPSIFTRHGLGRDDLVKPRNKEEMKCIFENIGVQFPDNSFDLLWEKGLEKYNAQSLSVLTFRNLCDEYDTMINKMDS